MSARGWSNYTPESYMRDEEREANRRMRRRDPFKAEREEAFRAGLSGDWRAPRKPMAVRRPRRTLRSRVADAAVRIFEAIRAIPGGEPSKWRDAAVFGIGAAWGAMVAVGILLAIAARHAP